MGSSETAQDGRHIFISYARRDEVRAREIVSALEQAGTRVWIDWTGIGGGQEWAAVIVNAIRNAGQVLVLCSENSLQSRNIRRELQIAWDHDIPILPAMLEPVTFPDSVSFFLQGVQWVELFQPTGWDRLVAALAPEQESSGSRAFEKSLVKLPPASTLIGRDESVRELVESIAEIRERLVTIVGPGGIGKTVLAATVGAAVVPSFPGGVIFVDLAPVRESSQVSTAIGQALDIGASSAMTLDDRLASMLADKQLLLILDNFEQVLEAASFLAALLAGTSALQVLVTSRTPIRIRGEHIYRAHTLVEGDDVDAAFELFVTRAREAGGGFAVTDQNRPAISEICRRLDGLPLAIELAAARVRLFSPELMLSRMTYALPLLTGGSRDSPERHRTLTATIDWSYQLLSPPEQALLRLMGIFSGGGLFKAVEYVLAAVAGSSDDLFASLDALVEWGLVRHVSGDEPRFVMLETIREFAEAELVASGDGPTTREAHAAWCLQFALDIEDDLRNARDQARLFDLVENEMGNIRKALRYFQEIGDGSRLIRLVTAVDEYMGAHPFDRESFEWLEAGFSLDPEVDDTTAVIARGNASGVAGRIRLLDRAEVHARYAVELAEQSGSPYLRGRAYFTLGVLYEHLVDAKTSLAWYERAVDAFRYADADAYFAMSLAECADKLHWLGELERADELGAEGLARMRATGDRWALGMLLGARSQLAATLGNFDQSIAMAREALGISANMGDARTALGVIASIGRIAVLIGNVCDGVRLLSGTQQIVTQGHAIASYPSFFLDDTLQLARSRLKPNDYEKCCRQGSTPSFEELATAAQDVLTGLRPPSSFS